MTTTTLLALVRKKILEETEEIVDNDTLLTYATLVQQDIRKRYFPANDVTTSAVLAVSGGVATLPTTFGTLYGDAYDSQNVFYKELSIEDFKKEPLENAVTIEGGVLKVFPATTASITIKFYPIEEDVTLVVSPTIDAYLHVPLMYGVLGFAFEDLQNFAMSKYYNDKYETELTKRTGVQSNYEEANQDNGALFNGQNLISGSGGFNQVNSF